MSDDVLLPPARPFQRGDFVIISAHGVSKGAMVVLASENGRSLMVMCDGGLFWPDDEGGYAGAIPLLQQDDGTYVELINRRPVGIELAPEPLTGTKGRMPWH
jgi:hypothetical protein